MTQNLILHDTRAAEPREPGDGRAAKIMYGPRHFDRVLRRLAVKTPSACVLSNAERLLREVSSGTWRWKSEYLIEFQSRLQQVDRLVMYSSTMSSSV